MVKKLQNEGTTDRVIRFIFGIVLASLGYFYLSGVTQTIVYVLGVVMVVTSLMGFCLLYRLFGIDTRGKTN